MMRAAFRRFSVISLILLPSVATAQRTLDVDIGTSFDFATIVQRIIDFLAASITTVATAMFLVGAFMIVLAGAKEDFKQRGKDLMIGSVMSVAVVLGAYAIYRTVASFLA
ncbi:hypothetical protein K8942_05860 [Candidatus Peribacteria bacterium]|nr:MAG: hypothetical protein K8942_05860 [Candidatus Peribacteria bacterium]